MSKIKEIKIANQKKKILWNNEFISLIIQSYTR